MTSESGSSTVDQPPDATCPAVALVVAAESMAKPFRSTANLPLRLLGT